MKRLISAMIAVFFLVISISFMERIGLGLLAEASSAGTDNDQSRIIETDNFMDYSEAVSTLTRNQENITVEKIADLDQYYTKRLIVKTTNDSASLQEYPAETVIKGPDGVTVLQFSTIAETKACMEELIKSPEVEYAEPDILYGIDNQNDAANKEDSANAALKGEPSGMEIKSTYNSWGVKKIEADKYAAYLRANKKAGITVAVVDSGVSENKYLKGRIAKGGYDFYAGNNNPWDRNGHGTHVAGTIADCTPKLKVKILPIRVLNENGVGSAITIANGIKYAANKGAKVINISLGGDHTQYLDNAVTYAVKKGAVVVAAAGNEYGNVEYSCPAHNSKCVTVAAIDSKERRADFSNYGLAVDISGPGVDILSCVPGGSLKKASGTSMATPHIAAAAAMIRMGYPSKSVSEVEKILKNISKDLGAKGRDIYFGYGLPKLSKIINAKKVKLSQSSATVRRYSKIKLTAAVTPGGYVTWSSGDSKIASVDGNGLVTGRKTGKTVITATTVNGLKASCNLKVVSDKIPVVKPTGITLDKSSVTLEPGKSVTLNGTVKPADTMLKEITWSSSNEEIAAVTEFGTVTAYRSGKAVITAATENGLTAVCDVTVTGDGVVASSISLNQKKLKILIGETAQLWATVLPDNSTDKRLKWNSSNDNLTVSQEGKIKAVKAGVTTVRVETMTSLYDECEVTVIDPQSVIKPTSVRLNHESVEVEVGAVAYLIADVGPANTTEPEVTFSSSNTLIADVTPNGIVIGKLKGYALITVRTSNGLKATCKVTVVNPVVPASGIVLNKNELQLEVNQTETLVATVLPTGATDKKVIWSSSDTTVMSVDSSGWMFAKKEGKAVITARTSNGLTAACVVTVKRRLILPYSVYFDKWAVEVEAGQKVTLKVVISPQNADDKTLAWVSSDKSIADVDNNGVVTGIKAGVVKITVKTSNGKTDTCTITVKGRIILAEGITLDQKELQLVVNEKAVLTAAITPENAADKKVSWESSDTSVATAGSDGIVTGHKAGIAVITAKTSNGLTASCTITVKPSDEVPAGVSLNYTQLELEIGTAAALIAAVTPIDTVNKTIIWSSSDNKIAEVSSDGVVTGHNAGIAVITAMTESGVSASCTVTVKAMQTYPQAVTLDRYEVLLAAGSSAKLSAVIQPDNATERTLIWQSADSSIASVDVSGIITAVAEGTTSITVYTVNQCSAVCIVTVQKPAENPQIMIGMTPDFRSIIRMLLERIG